MTIKDWINWQTVQGVVRHAAQWGGGVLVANGVISQEQNGLLLGAALSVAALVWSYVESRQSKANIEVVKAVAVSGTTTQNAVVDAAKKSPAVRERPVIDAIHKAIDKING